jgi:putative phage-type endonuclease
VSLTPEQVEQRRHSLGASEIAAVIGVNPHMSMHQVWLSKMGLADFAGNDATEAGTDFEPVIIQRYARHHGVEVRPGAYMTGPEPWMSCTPDAHVIGGGMIEAKLVGFDAAWEWGSEHDGAPWRYLVQGQWQLMVTGEPFVDIAAQMGTRAPRYIRVHHDRALQAELRERGREFWFNYVTTGEAPPVDGTEGAREMLSKLYPAHRADRFLHADGEAEALAAQLLGIREVYDATVHEERRLENRLKEIMKDAQTLIGNEWKCVWKAQKDGKRPFKFKHQAEKKVAA